MDNQQIGLYGNITLNDVQLAAAYYPILIDLAKHKHCLTYGELVEKAKEIYPEKDYVKNAIPVSAGRKLDVVRIFTNERNLPDVTSLIINKSQGECGSGFTGSFDPVEARSKVFAYDWSEVAVEFDLYINDIKESTKPKKRLSHREATRLMSIYYQENKNYYPETIRKSRSELIALIMEGFSEKEAFDQISSSGA